MRKLSIYIVDDSEFNNFYLEDLLGDVDFVESVTVFINPLEALEDLKSKVAGDDLPDLILLDINMPHMTGFELINELDALGSQSLDDLKIFIISSSDHKYDLEAFAKQPRAQEYLLKPIVEEQLRKMIQKHFPD